MNRWVGDLEANNLLDDVTVVHCGVFKNMETHEVVKFTPDTIHKLPEFLDTVDMLIGHNFIKYDLKVLEKLMGYEYKGVVYDTLILSRILKPNRTIPYNCTNRSASPHGLEAWGYRVGRGKPEHDDWEHYSEAMLHRCSEDVEINELVYYALQDEMVDGDWSTAIPMTMKLFQVFDKIEDYGWKVDEPLIHEHISTLTDMQEELLEDADQYLPYVVENLGVVNKPFTKAGKYSAVITKWINSHMPEYYWWLEHKIISGPFTRVKFRKVDLNKRVEVIKILLEEGWEPEQWNVSKETGEKTSPKLSQTDPFDGVEGDLGEIAAKFLQVRHRKSLLEGLLKLIRPDGRIGSKISGLAETARVKHAGIVNIPNADAFFGPEIRRVFTHDKDRILVGVDSAGNQVRQLTSLMGDDAYEYEVLHGDIHEANRIAAGLPTRSNAKTFFYGFLFGAGDEKTGRIVGEGAATGKRLKEQFLAGLPKLEELLDRLKGEWRENAKQRRGKWGQIEYYDGWVAGLDGRPIYIKSEHAILVYVLQNMEAIQMEYALLFTYKWLEESDLVWGEDYGIVCFYHDEINAECKPEYAEFIGETIKRSIITAGTYLNIKTPHDGDISIGENWYEIH